MYYTGPFKTWADDLASNKPAPGGGSAAALVGVSGCALLSMVANFTIGKKKYMDVEGEMKTVLDQAEQLRGRLALLVDEDVQQYSVLTAAYGLPKSTDSEKQARSKAIQDALKVVVQVPLKICETCAEAVKLAPVLAEKGNSGLVSDVGVGVQCLSAAFRSGWLNVEINLASLNDKAFVDGIRSRLDPMGAGLEQTTRAVWELTVRKIKG